MRSRFGVRLPVTGPLASPENIVAIGDVASELGFDAATTHDHVSHSYDTRYHNAGGVAETVDELDKQGAPVTNVYETMTTLSVVAGRAPGLRLIPCASVLPWRHPVLFAKQAVSLHELSGGRFVCCVCVGNIRSDFEAMGVDYGKRGLMMNEYLEVLRLIFSNRGTAGFDGSFVTLSPSEFNPRPSTRLPVWIAGQFIDAVFERVAKYGDGYLPSAQPDELREGLPRLAAALRSHGRSLSEIEIGTQTFMCLMGDGDAARRKAQYTIESFYHGSEFDEPDPKNPARTRRDAMKSGTLENALVGSPDEVIGKIERYIAAGASFFDIRQVNRTLDDVKAQLRLFAKEVLPSFG